ncbi:hypothetical protein ALC53_09306 [Atta colombica]|uniref:Uncharacterized protein n=1 Tax=Atta colombica TaxID=520822 RepID=A0A195B7J1_9HYME|nr:hypothetical protein ALC53_09306 [Atta colombica]
MILSLNISRCFRNKIDLEKYTFYSINNVSNIILVEYLKSLLIFVYRYATIERQQQQRISKLSLKKTWRSSSASGGGDAIVNKGGRCASRGFNPGVGAYFTVCGPISRRQSEPARIHHRVTPRNNFLHHNELLSKPSYLFISPRPLLLSFFRLLCLTTRTTYCSPSHILRIASNLYANSRSALLYGILALILAPDVAHDVRNCIDEGSVSKAHGGRNLF